MAVRSKRLWGPVSIGASHVTLYTCPAGRTAIIKQLNAVNVGLATSSYQLRLNGTTASQNIAAASIAAGADEARFDRYIVLGPGDVLRMIGTTVAIISSGFGVELDGVAP